MYPDNYMSYFFKQSKLGNTVNHILEIVLVYSHKISVIILHLFKISQIVVQKKVKLAKLWYDMTMTTEQTLSALSYTDLHNMNKPKYTHTYTRTLLHNKDKYQQSLNAYFVTSNHHTDKHTHTLRRQRR